eukprot:1730667-Rhodomonas_salina.1
MFERSPQLRYEYGVWCYAYSSAEMLTVLMCVYVCTSTAVVYGAMRTAVLRGGYGATRRTYEAMLHDVLGMNLNK